MIDAYIIRIDNNGTQTESAAKCLASIRKTDSQVDPIFFGATVPDTIDKHLKTEFKYYDSTKWKWSWPTDPSQNILDLKTGLYKFYYEAADQQKKLACTLSHMRLWDKCVTDNKPILILEADALFTRQFNLEEVKDAVICGLNDPRKATRRAGVFHEKASQKHGIQPVPTVNRIGEPPVPQGIAGNSAYYITPEGAKALLDFVSIHGAWPNDALMCKEMFPQLRIVYPYFTRVQGTESTTTR